MKYRFGWGGYQWRGRRGNPSQIDHRTIPEIDCRRVNRTVSRRAVIALAATALGALPLACSTSTTAPTLTSLVVTGLVPSVGQASQLVATATLSDSSVQNVTTIALWTSSNTTVATVTATGVLTVLASGGATITATYDGVNATLTFVAPYG